MTRWPNTTTDTDTKRANYDVTTSLVRLPVVFSAADRSLDRVRAEPSRGDRGLTELLIGYGLLKRFVQRFTIITFLLVVIGIFLSLAPSLTGEAQEGQSRDWMGEKLSARSVGR